MKHMQGNKLYSRNESQCKLRFVWFKAFGLLICNQEAGKHAGIGF